MAVAAILRRLAGNRHQTLALGGGCSFRSFATETLASDPAPAKNPPMLMLSTQTKPYSSFLYDPAAGKITREINLAGVARHHAVGTSQGYLLSVDSAANLHATEPLSGAHLPLPPATALPQVSGVLRDSIRNPNRPITDFVIAPDPNDESDDGEITTAEAGSMVHHNYRKAILSPDLKTAVIIQFGDAQKLAFARVGAKNWTNVGAGMEPFDDVIYHGGKIHAVNLDGTLIAFDVDSPAEVSVLAEGSLEEEDQMWNRFLVGSPDGRDLFLVLRVVKSKKPDEEPRTRRFKVFKLDEEEEEWRRVKSVGDLALFLGCNESVAFNAGDFNLKPNTVYFTNDYRRSWRGRHLGGGCSCFNDTGIFSLQDGSFEPLSHPYDNLENWIQKKWLVPAV